MYSLEWQIDKKKGKKQIQNYSNIIKGIVPVIWEEHCLECSPPECYSSCINYFAREDKYCVRILDGISKCFNYPGIYGYSVKVHFRKWSKIEILYRSNVVSIQRNMAINRIIQFGNEIFKFSSKIFWFRGKNRWLIQKKWELFRQKMINWLTRKSVEKPNIFLVDVYSEHQNSNLIMEIKTPNIIIERKILNINKGRNTFYIPIDAEKLDKFNSNIYIYIYCEDVENEYEYFFSTIELVRADIPQDNEKVVKCVVWDLDNTLWKGVISENSVVEINWKIIHYIRELESKGIVSSIASKNDYDETIKYLKAHEILDLFLIPQINWGAKSKSIKTIADQLNIGIDSIVFIDDMAFELEEVASNAVGCRCFNVRNIDEVMKMECFNPQTSHESVNRKKQYIDNLTRNEDEKSLGSINAFIKQAELKLYVNNGRESNVDRYYELMQRTNQLNVSVRRLDKEEIIKFLESHNTDIWEVSLSDKYGNYGIVGLVIIDILDSAYVVTDMLFSCRAAMKYVEENFSYWLANYYLKDCNKMIYINYIITEKNKSIIDKFVKLGFKDNGKNQFFASSIEQIIKPIDLNIQVIDVREGKYKKSK